jgi:hypothetical protein
MFGILPIGVPEYNLPKLPTRYLLRVI